MTDGKEETIYCYVISFFIRLAFSLYHMCAFHSVFTEKAHSVVLEQHFYLLMIEHTVLHDLGSAQIRFAHNEVNLLCQTCQIDSLLARGISAAHYCHCLVAIEESVASGACADSHARIFFLIVQSQIFGRCACGNDYRVRIDFLFSIHHQFVGSFREIHRCDDSAPYLCSELQSLLTHVFHHLRACNPFRVSRKVFHFGCDSQLSAGLYAFIQYRRNICPARIYSSCISGRAGTNDQTSNFFHNIIN